MKNILRILVSGVFCVSAMSFGCNKPQNCTKDTKCTMQFAAISITINDLSMPPAGTKITVDVFDFNNGRFIKNDVERNSITGKFEILNDGDFQWLGQVNQAEKFRVDVKRNGVVVKSEEYMMGRDCCHVFKASGPNKINL